MGSAAVVEGRMMEAARQAKTTRSCTDGKWSWPAGRAQVSGITSKNTSLAPETHDGGVAGQVLTTDCPIGNWGS